MVCEPIHSGMIEKISIPGQLALSTADDPSFRHWVSKDGKASLVLTRPCSASDAKMHSRNSVRAKEIIVTCAHQQMADNFLALLHAGILLGYPEKLKFAPMRTASKIGAIEDRLLREDTIAGWFNFHHNAAYGCIVAQKAWSTPSVRYGIHKWRLSRDLDSFTPHSAAPIHGQVFPTHYPDERYHVDAAYAIIAGYSAIEELGLEVRSSREKPRFLKDQKDQWNPVVLRDISERLGEVGIDAAEEIEWVIRGAPRRIERELQPILGYDSSWSNSSEVRDGILKVVDAIHYSSFIRNFVAAHKFGELVGELGPYDVFNVQSVARRLLLGCLGIWKTSIADLWSKFN